MRRHGHGQPSAVPYAFLNARLVSICLRTVVSSPIGDEVVIIDVDIEAKLRMESRAENRMTTIGLMTCPASMKCQESTPTKNHHQHQHS